MTMGVGQNTDDPCRRFLEPRTKRAFRDSHINHPSHCKLDNDIGFRVSLEQ